jgi:predicted MPP superfamily phosphohydrolase
MLTRRQLLKGAGAFAVSGMTFGGYAFAIEPYRLAVREYELRPKQWVGGPDLRIVAIADVHACEPWMPEARLRQIVARTNELQPDLVVMLGDFKSGHKFKLGQVANDRIAAAFSELQAPLGAYTILGNHDWWEDPELQYTREGPTPVGRALEAVGIPVLENNAVRLTHNGKPFWLAGLGDQWAFYLDRRRDPYNGRFGFQGVDDLPKTLAALKDDAPAILLAHEPDIFAETPERFALTLSGHTHGGQVQLFGWAPKIPSRYGYRYMYGHVTEPGLKADGPDRHLIVSGGLGCSGAPIRFGRPPELVVVDIRPPRSLA